MNDAISEELNGLKVNIKQDGVAIDQIQTFRNMDRSNVNDCKYDSIRTYKATKGYTLRMKEHNQWLEGYYS
tara:strand:+ start:513 stop:725 length:213 start_codon:yes stop_codon:yes gene_type:complete